MSCFIKSYINNFFIYFLFVKKNAIGDDLMTLVCNDLELVEREYFSLTYRDVNNMKVCTIEKINFIKIA